MASTTYILAVAVLLSIALIPSSSAAVYKSQKDVLPDDETRQDMLDDLLQREYADRYRDYIENSLAAAEADNSVGGGEARSAARPYDKRAQTFVRFGKRAQTFVRFGK